MTVDNEYFFIVDQSGSMNRFPFDKLTEFKNQLVGSEKQVNWIPFATKAVLFKDKDFIKRLDIGYSTNMEAALNILKSFEFNPKNNHYVVVITDGHFDNTFATLNVSESLSKSIPNLNFGLIRIGNCAEVSGLVPFFVSTETSNVYDLGMAFDYASISLSFEQKIEIENGKYYPWDTDFTTISVFPSDIYYSGQIVTDDILLKFVEKYSKSCRLKMIGGEKIETEHVKEFIVNHFNAKKDSDSGSPKGFYMKQKGKLELILANLNAIHKQTKFDKLNEQQKANFLRELNISNATVKRGMKMEQNMDLKKTLLSEIQNVIDHKAELESIPEGTIKSMISLETTLDSLLYIANQPIAFYNDFDVLELLKMINIVGIAVNAPIGDYPDPKTWNINSVSNVYTSVSDFIYNVELGQVFKGPDKIKITNVLPVFESIELFEFCKTHLKNTMNLLCGFGMRRVLMLIPQTFRYTMLNGFTESIQKGNSSEWNWTIINQLLMPVGILSTKKELKLPTNGCYIELDNDKLSDLVLNVLESEHLPFIFRNLYSLEYALFASRWMSKQGELTNRDNYVLKLLNVDLTVDNSWNFDNPLLDSLIDKLSYFDTIFQIPKASKLSLEDYKKVVIDYESELQLQDMTLKEFKKYVLIQGFLYRNRSERYRDDCINVKDLFKKEYGQELITTFIEKMYKQESDKIKRIRFKNEQKIITAKASDFFITSTFDEFTTFVETKIINTTHYKISKMYQKAFIKNAEHVVDFEKKIKWFICGGDAESGYWNDGNCVVFLFRFIPAHLKKSILLDIRPWKFRKSGEPNRHGHDESFIRQHIKCLIKKELQL